MAYQTRQRDPLLDSDTCRRSLERRGRELIGLASCWPDRARGGADAGVLFARRSELDVGHRRRRRRTLLGRFGASIASPLVVIAGLAPGARGAGRGLGAAPSPPPRRGAGGGRGSSLRRSPSRSCRSTPRPMCPRPGWAHSFGLGGLFGDTVLGAFLGMMPLSAALGLRFAAFGTADRGGLDVGLCARLHPGRTAAAGRWGAPVARLRLRGDPAASRAAGRPARLRGVSAGTRLDRPSAVPRGWRCRRRLPLRRTSAPEPPRARGFSTGRSRSWRGEDPEPELMTYDDPSHAARRPRPLPHRRRGARGTGERPAPALDRAEPPVVRRTPMAGPDPVDLDDEDDFDLDDYTLPEHELVEGRAPLVAAPMFETARSAEPRRGAVQHPPARRRALAPGPGGGAALALRREPRPTTRRRRSASSRPPSRSSATQLSDEALEENARMLESVLDDYGVKGEITVRPPRPGRHACTNWNPRRA